MARGCGEHQRYDGACPWCWTADAEIDWLGAPLLTAQPVAAGEADR